MNLTEYQQNVPARQQAIIRHDAKGWWYATLADGSAWHNKNGEVIRRYFAADLYTYLTYMGFSPRYEE